jgi:hypothetical protein
MEGLMMFDSDLVVVGRTHSQETYDACVASFEAQEIPGEAITRLGLTLGEWVSLGKQILGRGGFEAHMQGVLKKIYSTYGQSREEP